ncbi:MAG: DNA helicase UvrD [Desulfobacteraceae bacterium 4572_130]|nr:MAG: DNA helicase UvrD [Desulfobacteraceae bacterium 4572_130]
MKLSKQQQNAIHHTGSPALVVAGAGSGKTRTLTAKILHLIESGYSSSRILAITFTNKAADEMKSRLYKLTGINYVKFPWVRTYHSACFLIFKKHCHVIGYSSPIQVCTGYHQKKMMVEVLEENKIEKKYAATMISFISKAKNSGNPEKFISQRPQMLGIRTIDLFKQYEEKLFTANSVDFDNILLKTRNILRDNKNIRDYYKNFFTHILVDEYQDTNNLQDELTRLLLKDHGNLFCVGDDWQSVYGFRGSNVNLFLQFSKRYKNSKIFRLEQNYRSTNEIVQTANGLIAFNHDKIDKKCFSKKSGGTIEIHDFFSDSEEAAWIAKQINSLNSHKHEVDYGKIAVIYRTKFCSLAFEKTFRNFKIPYKLMGSQGFFERMEILDLNSYLNACFFPEDNISFKRIINTPKRGIGAAMIKKIEGFKTNEMSLQDAARKIVKEKILKETPHEKIRKLLDILDSIKTLPPSRAIEKIIFETEYYAYLEKKTKTRAEFISKKENIEQLIFTARGKDNILEYLEEAALIREDKDDNKKNSNKKVSLLTIHSAKGLEFNTVFIVGCEENLFPHWRSIELGEKALQEERRLMYVAMTRAKKFLYFSYSSYRKGRLGKKSRFINQIEECL